MWHSTLDLMTQHHEADLPTLQRIRAWITDGVTLDLVSTPECIDHENTFSVLQEADAVRVRIQEYIDFGALVLLPADHPLPYGVQPLHVIIKEGRKPRLVIDLSRNMNDHLEYQYFSYSSVREAVELASPRCWFSKLDLSNCFLSFPLHPSAWPHFIFRFEGQLHQFTSVPFGLSSAPRICTELLSVVAFRLTLEATERNLRFLDDFLLIDQDEVSARTSLATAQTVIDAFGLVVNTAKTEGPAQRLAFLGILLDSCAQTLSCTPERLAELHTLLANAVTSTKMRLTALASLIGKLQFVAHVLPGARPFTRRLIDLCSRRNAALDRQSSRSHDSAANLRRRHFAAQRASVRTDRGFRADIRFWQDHLLRWNGTQRWRSAQSAPFVFASDASLSGFGYYLESAPTATVQWSSPSSPASVQGSTPPSTASVQWPSHLRVGSGFSGTWSHTDAHLHSTSGQMTWCELFAVYAALFTYRTVLRHCCVLFLMDNQSDVHVLNRQATRSPRLAGLLREIYTIAVEHNISLYARHRPGVENVLADFLSRRELHGGADIVSAWATAHPALSSRLSVVSRVYSHQFGNEHVRPSSTSSKDTC